MLLSCEPLCSRLFGTLVWTGSGHWGEFNIEDVLSSEYYYENIMFELHKYSIRDCFQWNKKRLLVLKLDHQIN